MRTSTRRDSDPTYTAEDHPGRRSSDKGTYCPKCHNMIQPGHMGDHNFHVHGDDRRQTAEQKTPPPPEKRERRTPKTEPKEEGGEGNKQGKRKTSRWFASRPE